MTALSDGKTKVNDTTTVSELHTNRSLVVNLMSGGMGGFCVVLVGYPFDFLKTRLQTSSESLMTAARSVWRTAGWRGFYQGASAPLIGVSPVFAVNFYGYELGKRVYDSLFGTGERRDYSMKGGLPVTQYAFAGAFSSMQTALVVIPADRIKVFMQLPRPADSELARLNAVQVGMRLYKEGGIRALFRGSTATLLRDVPGLTTFFATYETLKLALCPPQAEVGSMSDVLSVMAAGGAAGVTSWVISLPFDVLKSRVQAAGKTDALSTARFPTWVVLRDLLKNEGPTALYRGWLPVLLRAFPANAACFLGYEATKVTLQSVL
jgi:solute carrier family 25 carnitine/acylcarnitine transporter 20/29